MNKAVTMTDRTVVTADADGRAALERMREREEVLEICFWYQGEGLGSSFAPALVQPFLNSDPISVAQAFEALVGEGSLARDGERYVLTTPGRRRAGRMFTETFVEFQQPGHGECQDGCCDGDEPCPTHNAVVTTATARAQRADCGFEHRFGEVCAHPAFVLSYRRP